MIRSRCSRTNRRRSAGEALSSRVKGARSDQIELKFSPQPHLRVSKPGPDISALHLQLREPSPVEFAGLCQAEPEFVAVCFYRPLWGAAARLGPRGGRGIGEPNRAGRLIASGARTGSIPATQSVIGQARAGRGRRPERTTPPAPPRLRPQKDPRGFPLPRS